MDVQVESNGFETPKSILRRTHEYPMKQLSHNSDLSNGSLKAVDSKITTVIDSKNTFYPGTNLQYSPVRKLRIQEQSWTAGQKAAKLAVILAILIAVALLCASIILYSFSTELDAFSCGTSGICDFGSGKVYQGVNDKKAPWNQMRLPHTLYPLSYHLNINLQMDFFRMTGSVSIFLMCTQNATSVIVLHHRPNFGSDSGYQGRGQTGLGNPAGGRYEGPRRTPEISPEDLFVSQITLFHLDSNQPLSIDQVFWVPTHEFLVLTTRSVLRVGSVYNLTLPISAELMGPESVFDHTKESFASVGTMSHSIRQRHIFALRAFPANLRSLFACLDEPRFRSNFSVIIQHDSTYKVFMQTKIDYEISTSDFVRRGTVDQLFSVPMPTYMLSMIIVPDSYQSYSYHYAGPHNRSRLEHTPKVALVGTGVSASSLFPSSGTSGAGGGAGVSLLLQQPLCDVILQLVWFCQRQLSLQYPNFYIHVHFLPNSPESKGNSRSHYESIYDPITEYNRAEYNFLSGFPSTIIMDPSNKPFEEIVQHLFRAVIFHFTHVVLALNWWDEYWSVIGLSEFLLKTWQSHYSNQPWAVNFTQLNIHRSTSMYDTIRPTNHIDALEFQFLKKFWRAVQINARNPVEILPSFQTGVANSTAIRNMQIIQNPIAAIKAASLFSMLSSVKRDALKHIMTSTLCRYDGDADNRGGLYISRSCGRVYHVSNIINSFLDLSNTNRFAISTREFFFRWAKYEGVPEITLKTNAFGEVIISQSEITSKTAPPHELESPSSETELQLNFFTVLLVPVHFVGVARATRYEPEMADGQFMWLRFPTETHPSSIGRGHLPLSHSPSEDTPYFLANYPHSQWAELSKRLLNYSTTPVLSDVKTRYSLLCSAYILVQNSRLPAHILFGLVDYGGSEYHPLGWEVVGQLTHASVTLFHSTMPSLIKRFYRPIWSSMYKLCDLDIDFSSLSSSNSYKTWACQSVVSKWTCFFESGSNSMSCHRRMRVFLEFLMEDYKTSHSKEDKIRWFLSLEHHSTAIQTALSSSSLDVWEDWLQLLTTERSHFSSTLKNSIITGLAMTYDNDVNANIRLWEKLKRNELQLSEPEAVLLISGLCVYPQSVLLTLDHLSNLNQGYPQDPGFLQNVFNSSQFCPVILQVASFITAQTELDKLNQFFQFLSSKNLSTCVDMETQIKQKFIEQLDLYSQNVAKTREWLKEFLFNRMKT
ncbi:uncharacterized protein LOC134841314 [Symsagittifera roscoffensis]|uniref:uncharacterized protein LOC134841314 n=1 Tax=Symsagittifera roscoffensis TaxID=84072 RepID=UPI00307BD01D